MVVFSNILKEEATLRPRPIPQGPFQCDSEVASPIDMAAAEGGLGAGRPLESPQAPESSLLRHQEATLLWPWALSNFCSRLQIFFFTLASHLLMKAQLPFSELFSCAGEEEGEYASLNFCLLLIRAKNS